MSIFDAAIAVVGNYLWFLDGEPVDYEMLSNCQKQSSEPILNIINAPLLLEDKREE